MMKIFNAAEELLGVGVYLNSQNKVLEILFVLDVGLLKTIERKLPSNEFLKIAEKNSVDVKL